MGWLDTLLGRRAAAPAPPAPAPAAAASGADQPATIRVFDAYGRELHISREDWRDKVLLTNLEQSKNSPEALHTMLVGALQDGFAIELLPYAEHLHRTDPDHARGATILGIVQLQLKRWSDACRTLEGHLATHGEDGVVMTNLAKAYAGAGDQARAERTLWRALELEPNQDNGLMWYAAIERERSGEGGDHAAFTRVAGLPRSWRARLWLARHALDVGDAAGAFALYDEALAMAGTPAPADLLMQLSGDLGQRGKLAHLVQYLMPRFDVPAHGLMVGNNLIKALVDLGRPDDAKAQLERLHEAQRPDWSENLAFWDTEIAKARIAIDRHDAPAQPEVGLTAVAGPSWMRRDDSARRLLPTKPQPPRRVAILGSTVVHPKDAQRGGLELADPAGRLSRALPLFLAEQLELRSEASTEVLTPVVRDQGFAVFGMPYPPADLARIGDGAPDRPELVVSLVTTPAADAFELTVSLVRTVDAEVIGCHTVHAERAHPDRGAVALADALLGMLRDDCGIAPVAVPDWYVLPAGPGLADYLLRLEQHLALRLAEGEGFGARGINGEHEMLEGALRLCVSEPRCAPARLLLAGTVAQLKQRNAALVGRSAARLRLLIEQHPLHDAAGRHADLQIEQHAGG